MPSVFWTCLTGPVVLPLGPFTQPKQTVDPSHSDTDPDQGISGDAPTVNGTTITGTHKAITGAKTLITTPQVTHIVGNPNIHISNDTTCNDDTNTQELLTLVCQAFNCHGFKQSSQYIGELFTKCDVLCLSETCLGS